MAIVTLYDLENEEEVTEWARVNCPSLWRVMCYEPPAFALPVIRAHIKANTVDDIVSDWLTKHEFEFGDEQEAMLFQLRWDGQ